MKYRVIAVLLGLLLCLGASGVVQAQCPMCKSNVEAGLRAGGDKGKGLNTGILYLLAIPYLLSAGVAMVWYHQFREKPEPQA